MSATAILAAIQLGKAAFDTVAQFADKDSRVRQVEPKLQDAVDVITAIVPLVDGFRNGREVTENDVRRAISTKDQALADFDAEIAKQS
jgi:hypothetical protein